jgi:uncharacterized protein
MTRHKFFLTASLLVISLFAPRNESGAADSEQDTASYIRAHYTKYEYMVPMRDGIRLFTSVYTPKGRDKQWPVMLLRTPYSVAPYGLENYRGQLGPASEKFMRDGYIFVYQDVRGRVRSEGSYMNVRPVNPARKSSADTDDASDTYDTVDWLVRNLPNNNGRVGMWGISYPGFYAALGAVDSHPALKAVSPQAPIINWFIGDDFRHNGAIFLAHAYGFFSQFGLAPTPGQKGSLAFDMGTPDAYEFHLGMGALAEYDAKLFQGKIEFWKELLENDTLNDFWKARDPRPFVKNIKPAMMTVGGWFDAEDVYGPLHLYEAAEKQSPGASNMLVEGPWSHGGWARTDGSRLGNIAFGSNTSKFFQEEIEYPFFQYHLKGTGEGGKLPEAYVFETGRNEWHKMDDWPPKQARPKTLYLQKGGMLSWSTPEAGGESYDEYISDPMKPIPFTPYTASGMSTNYMTDDQRFASSRTDVLVYSTQALDADVRVAGPLKASLYVSTTGTDSDFIVKLIDVFPGDAPNPQPNPENVKMGGYQMLVRGEPFRGKFRKSFSQPEPFTPGKMEKIEFEMPDIFHAFRRGHRIMIQVQSSWFPLVDRNPQKFMKIHEARESDFQKATQKIYRSPAAASSLTVHVLE